MIFAPLTIIALAITMRVLGHRHNNDLYKSFAVVLVIAAIGTTMVTYLALSVI